MADRTATVVVTEGLRYRLSAPGVPAERLAALVDWAERHSPVTAAARRPLPVTVVLETG